MKEGLCQSPACRNAGLSVRIVCRGLCRTCYDKGRKSGAFAVRPGHGRKWSAADERFLIDKRAAGWTYKRIASAMRRNLTGVRLKAYRLGMKDPVGKGHGRGGPSLERQSARVAFILEHKRFPDRNGNPGRPLPKWFFTERGAYNVGHVRKDGSDADDE